MANRSQGYTMIELMVVCVVIGVLAAIAAPLYSKYSESARMGKANHFYQEAIKLAKSKQTENRTAIAIGATLTAPTTSEGWIAEFGGGDQAPGGGPAYVTSPTGDPATGAIGVTSVSNTIVAIYRPAYLDLGAYQATVDDGNVVEVEL